jgi:hypothetical protein
MNSLCILNIFYLLKNTLHLCIRKKDEKKLNNQIKHTGKIKNNNNTNNNNKKNDNKISSDSSKINRINIILYLHSSKVEKNILNFQS